MTDNHLAAADLLQVVSECHRLLGRLEAPVRSKAIKMLLLAFDEMEPVRSLGHAQPASSSSLELDPVQSGDRINRRAQHWLKRYNLREEELERVLDLDSGFALIAHLPQDSKREQAIGCYLLTGLQAMLRTGEPKFRDDEAVALCKQEGCYDRPNHATTRAQLGKRVTGDKESSFTLTTLGLEHAAALVRRMAGG